MDHIAIISSSVREGRLSHRAALFLQNYITRRYNVTAEILDLRAYDFPLFTERFMFQKEPSEKLLDFTGRFTRADGIWIVTPVYNASFPAALKNVIDLYYKEWMRKPVAVTTVTSGMVPGIATLQEVQSLLLKLGAIVTPVMHTVIEVGKEYDEQGVPARKENAEALAKPTLDEFIALGDLITGKKTLLLPEK